MIKTYRLPDSIETARYLLRRVKVEDAQAIFDGYSTDTMVTRFLCWKPHQNVTDTTAFLQVAASEWDSGEGFPLIAFDRQHPA